ncbi:MAG: SNF2-related protein [Bacteroidota bacterium]|nr:SNF2-related protein [Bacteroidota bacterium]
MKTKKKISVSFSELLTGKRKAKKPLGQRPISKQINASAMAWQTLYYNENSNKNKNIEANSYKHLRGVILADEVGGGKTYETLAILSKKYLESYPFTYTRKKQGKRQKYIGKKNKRFRVLILANSSIQTKWIWKDVCRNEQGEIINPEICDYSRFIFQTKFKQNNEDKKELLISLFGKHKKCNRKTWENWDKEEKENNGIWLASFNLLPKAYQDKKTNTYIFKKNTYSRKNPFPEDKFDFIVIDEAHIAKSNSTNEDIKSDLNKESYKKVQALFNSNPKAKVLLLTATPFQNGLEDLLSMLRLIEKETPKKEGTIIKILINKLKEAEIKFREIKDNLDGENIDKQIDEFKELLHKKMSVDVDIKSLYTKNQLTHRKEGLNDYLRDVMVRNNKKPIEVEPIEIKLTPLEELQYLMLRSLVPVTNEEEKEMYPTKLSQLVSSDGAFNKKYTTDKRTNEKKINIAKHEEYTKIKEIFNNENLISARKINKTIKLINEITMSKANLNSSKSVITIFFRFLPSIAEFANAIKQETKYKFNIIAGSDEHFKDIGIDAKVKPIDRESLLEELKKNNRKKEIELLLISQVGNEGLDFDDFCDTIIHYDGHYNPAVIDQRNGRIYRGENIDKPENLCVYQVFLQDTYDARIKFIMEEKKKFKDFFLGTVELDSVLENDKNLKHKEEFINKLKNIKIDLTPNKKYLLQKYKKEIN